MCVRVCVCKDCIRVYSSHSCDFLGWVEHLQRSPTNWGKPAPRKSLQPTQWSIGKAMIRWWNPPFFLFNCDLIYITSSLIRFGLTPPFQMRSWSIEVNSIIFYVFFNHSMDPFRCRPCCSFLEAPDVSRVSLRQMLATGVFQVDRSFGCWGPFQAAQVEVPSRKVKAYDWGRSPLFIWPQIYPYMILYGYLQFWVLKFPLIWGFMRDFTLKSTLLEREREGERSTGKLRISVRSWDLTYIARKW